MASGFSVDKDKCQGVGCQASSGVTYYVEEKKKLCEECATKSGEVRRVKEDEIDLFCDQHDQPIKLYCQTHGVCLCQICAIKDHQKPCHLENIDAVLAEKRRKLVNLKETVVDKFLFWKDYADQISNCKGKLETHMQSIKNDVVQVINNDIEKVKETEQNTIQNINEKADEEIRKMTETINEKREARLQECHEDAEKQLHLLESRRRELLDDVTAIISKVQEKIDHLQCKARDVMKATDDVAPRIETLLEHDEKLLNDAEQLIASLADPLGKTAEEGAVEQITRTVNDVRFIKGVGSEKYDGRIAGFDGKWELCEKVDIPDRVNIPRMVGRISECEVIITDVDPTHFHSFVTNLSTKTTQRVFTSDGKSCIVSCALLDKDTIVCGKCMKGCTGDILSGCISLYDRQWKLIRDITLPRNTLRDQTLVYLAVDQDGMIIAAERNQTYIYVINPADGSIVNTTRCTCNIRLRGVLSSGDIVAQISYQDSNKLLLIDRKGGEREITHSEVIRTSFIDPLTDDLYVVFWDEEQNVVVVDRLSIQQESARGKTSFHLPLHHMRLLTLSHLVMLKSGKIVVSDKQELLVYRNIFV